jgi:hypothetical protein
VKTSFMFENAITASPTTLALSNLGYRDGSCYSRKEDFHAILTPYYPAAFLSLALSNLGYYRGNAILLLFLIVERKTVMSFSPTKR